ncbi:MAG TPA: DUF4149 domain-containing protein [Candidatus Limnocylindria bacterium]|jgi:hypothetical protein|nr:DUF4149 domain-containing protein [Candidatus Limnocylindria bacterium]
MSGWLRFLGILNTGIWLGAGLFLTVGAGQAVFSSAVLETVGREKAGFVAQAILSRYFVLQYVCWGIALVQWLAVKPAGKGAGPLIRLVVLGALVAGGGLWLQPKLHDLNKTRYTMELPEAERKEAATSFGKLHGLSQVMNLVLLGGVLCHLWTVSGGPRSKVAIPE